jgi:hypothetical protein
MLCASGLFAVDFHELFYEVDLVFWGYAFEVAGEADFLVIFSKLH